MKIRIQYIVIGFFIILLSIFSYNNYREHLNKPISIKFASKLSKVRKALLGKGVTSFARLIDDSLQNKNYYIVLIYTGFDCGGCVANGFYLVRQIDSLYSQQKVFVVGSNTNFSRDQLLHEYEGYIWIDSKDIIRKELKFLATPVVLLLDRSLKILEVYLPQPNDDRKKRLDFIDRLNRVTNIKG